MTYEAKLSALAAGTIGGFFVSIKLLQWLLS